jgi:DNA (cytosine-5)-methyltransferase 1
MTFGSLFAGIGGFDLGLERAGMECRWQVEIDPYASRVLEKHWPGVQRWADVRTFPVGNPADWHVDLICAGVPCQPVSHAGKQKGASDERWMWGEALRVVANLCPRFFVAENPIGLLNHDGGRTFHGILRAFASVGYVCEWHVIAAADVGAPHRRERVWLVAHADSFPCHQGESRRAIGGLQAAGAGSQGREDEGEARAVAGNCGANVADANSTGREQRRRASTTAAKHGAFECSGQDCGRSSWGQWARETLANAKHSGREGRNAERERPGATLQSRWWLAEPSVGRVAHGLPSRVDRLRCLGNAVVPQVAEVIGRAIIQAESQVTT